ncbi:MAG: FHA domain-containing protein [Isosphaeraceae bacterium]
MAGSGLGLKVVRGREVGRVYPLADGRTVLGNLAAADVLDLSAQESASPRRMSARQAEVEAKPGSLAVRDLDSPGGTFVNRQRLLSGETRPLRPGDVLQLGAVQLEVTPCPAPELKPTTTRAAETTARPPAPRPTATPTPPTSVPPPPARPRPNEPIAPAARPTPSGPFSTPFRLASGALCRTVDDFLTASAQDWAGLREEMTSGRLATFLLSQARSDLLPRADPTLPADERLDAWLASLPTTRPATFDLEVQPTTLKFRAVAGGGIARQKFVVTNTGYRLLRSTLRVEPVTAGWLRVAPSHFTTSEQTEVPVEVTIPEDMKVAFKATILVESNGGTRRVEVRLEPAVVVGAAPEAASAAEPSAVLSLSDWLAPMSSQTRVIRAAVALGTTRALLVAGDWFLSKLGGTVSTPPSLAGAALIFWLGGGLAGAAWVLRRGSPRDLFHAAFAGAFAGLFVSGLAVAACQSVEPLLGEVVGRSAVLATALWTFLGGLAGWLSRWPWPSTSPQALSPGRAST